MEKLIPVGVPLPWPTEIPPKGWLKCNGAAFDKSLYPKLAEIYPGGNLPDLRGEFIRGWDDGRKVDNNRTILSQQQATIIRTAMVDYNNDDTIDANAIIGLAFGNEDSIREVIANELKQPDGSNMPSHFYDNGLSSKVITNIIRPRFAITIRPRNIAFNYIVMAA
ncbi:phage tail protein [Photorhabdus australis]|uniref:phage tail protein n=1 Tax=Photorhabdus australis TaxID=286156 RepID=UPI000AC510B9|nr:phage tail protein [Photorhabdus australis]